MTTDELPDFQGPYDVTGGVTKRHAVSRASRPAPSTDSPMTEAEALDFVNANKWTFAKTMSEIPHFWMVLKDARDPAEFDRFVRRLYAVGKPMRWRKTKVRLYLDIDGWRYWTMDPTIESTDLINRQLLAISECVPA